MLRKLYHGALRCLMLPQTGPAVQPAIPFPVERAAKCLLLMAVSFFYKLVVFNNATDYNSNFQFVHHVLLMDSTFPGNHGLWRALPQTKLHTAFYLGIIAWETVTALLLWWGAARLVVRLRSPAATFERAKPMAVAALTLGALLWFVAFLSVGGEWFLMWQSHTWNGQDAAFRMFTCVMLVLLFLTRRDA